jgi:hypothetical protein
MSIRTGYVTRHCGFEGWRGDDLVNSHRGVGSAVKQRELFIEEFTDFVSSVWHRDHGKTGGRGKAPRNQAVNPGDVRMIKRWGSCGFQKHAEARVHDKNLTGQPIKSLCRGPDRFRVSDCKARPIWPVRLCGPTSMVRQR